MSLAITILSGSRRGFADGVVEAAYWDTPTCATCGANGDIWIVDTGNVRLRKIVDETVVSSLSGSRSAPFQLMQKKETGEVTRSYDPPFNGLVHMCHCANGESYVLDAGNGQISRIAGNSIFVIASANLAKYRGWQVEMAKPSAVRLDHTQTLWVANTGKGSVLSLEPGEVKRTNKFESPTDIAFSPLSNSLVFVADSSVNQIKLFNRHDPDYNIEIFAGTVISGKRDGWRAEAQFASPKKIAFAPNGDMFVSDEGNHCIRRISFAGYVTTFVGAAEQKPSVITTLDKPGSFCWNLAGDMIIPDSGQHFIYKVEMAYIPEQGRICLTESLASDLKLATFEFVHQSTQQRFSTIASFISLAHPNFLDLETTSEFLQNADVDPEALNAFLALICGSPFTLYSYSVAVDLMYLLVTLQLWDYVHELKPKLYPLWLVSSDENKVKFLKAFEAKRGNEEILNDVIRSIPLVYEPFSPSLVPRKLQPWMDGAYRGAGFLRDQLERLYWSTISGLPQKSARPIALFDKVPEHLQPNLELVTSDGVVKCHDFVLCARWRFVRNMFLFSGEEVGTRRVSLEDVGITADALQYIVYYMYTDCVDLLSDQSLCLSILKWCHELHLVELTSATTPIKGCERLIAHITKPFARPLSLGNAIDVYRAAIEGGNLEHEQRALQFIAQKLREFMASDRLCAELQTLPPTVLSTIMFLHFDRIWAPDSDVAMDTT